MNQIFLGQRAYGFASASEIYFGKPLKDITIAEAAMLAGLPKAPSANNPIVNPERATRRQRYVIDRMASNYNTRPRAAEVMVSGGEAMLIRERESLADLTRGEHLLDAGDPTSS